MKPWKRLEDVDTIQIGFQTVVRKRFIKNNGEEKIADIAGADQYAAFVLALTPKNEVIVARQFRCGPEELLDELPGGLVNAGETPMQAAKREFAEEVGYTSDNFELLGIAYTDGWDSLKRYYFLARDCRPVASRNLDSDEEIETRLISITELFYNARNARMVDVQAVLFAYDTLKELEDKR